MSEPVFVMAWRCEGETVVLPLIDRDGEMAPLAREIVDVFEARGIDPAAAVWRGIAGDRAEIIARLHESARTANELAEWYRERLMQLEAT